MKLIIQIPCFNEAENIGHTIALLPREIPGVDRVEILIVDDGSRDHTAEAALAGGADYVVKLPNHMGLAAAFAAGLDASLQRGADIILNTDADNQYEAQDIPSLLQPILKGDAQIVVGDRGVATLKYFHPIKRRLQTIGSRVVAGASGLSVPDATSGFRALTREAALRTVVLSDYSYTLETLIQAGNRKLSVAYIPVRTNPPQRPSRLMRGIVDYLINSSVTILRSYTMYRSLRVFTAIGLVLFLIGFSAVVRFMYFFALGEGGGHVQSLIIASIMIIIGFQTVLIGLVADLISFNRKMIEEVLYRLRKIQAE